MTHLLAVEVEAAVRSRFFDGLHPDAPSAVEYLVTACQEALSAKAIEASELAQHTGLPEESALAVMEDLVRFGLARDDRPGVSEFRIQPLWALCVRFDPLYMGWNADHDAVKIAKNVLGHEQVVVSELSLELGLPPRRMNPALFRLDQGRFVNFPGNTPGLSPFLKESIIPNSMTRAFAEGRALLPPIAPRAASQLRQV